jgi:hypothetical protein
MRYEAINGVTPIIVDPKATQTFANGATILDTTPEQNDLAGYVATTPQVPVLDRAFGYSVTFAVQIEQETHAGSDKNGDNLDDRAGFSLTVIGSDKKGIELAFWKDHIWIQNDGAAEPPGGTLFTHGEDVAFNTSTQILTYTVAVKNNTYSISSGGNTLLSGSVRDYSAWQPPVFTTADPYETPNLIVLSDNTTSASGKIRLAYVAVTSSKHTMYLPLVRK